MKTFQLYLLLFSYLLTATGRFVLTKLTNLQWIEEKQIHYHHPTFQTLIGFSFEFLIFAAWALMMQFKPKENSGQPNWVQRATQKVPLYIFLFPAVCDLTDSITLNMGMTQISPAIATMIRTLMAPASALLSKVLLGAQFSWQQLASITVIVAGVLVSCFVQLVFETEEDKVIVTAAGLLLLSLSACLQALQAVLEESIFNRDPDMPALLLGGAEAFWKCAISVCMLPFLNAIPCQVDICESGTLEDLGQAVSYLSVDHVLLMLVLANGLSTGVAQMLGYAVIKHENAVHKNTITLLTIAFTWIFFLFYPGEGRQEFRWWTLSAITVIFSGSYWFVQADHAQNKSHLGLDSDIKGEAQRSEAEEEVLGLLRGEHQSSDRMQSLEIDETKKID